MFLETFHIKFFFAIDTGVVLYLMRFGSRNQSCTKRTTWHTEKMKDDSCNEWISSEAYSADDLFTPGVS